MDTASDVTPRGLLGDRGYALVDMTDGKVATAKNPRKWPRLFEFAATYAEGPRSGTALPSVQITLPDGEVVSSADPDVDVTLSQALNRGVRLQAAERGQPEIVESTFPSPWVATSEEYWPDMEGLGFRDTVTDFELPEGTFFDIAVIHVLTTATLNRLTELYPEGQMATRRFRPNVVIDTGDATGFVENDWVGRTLHIGDQVQLAITEPCPRCVMITLRRGTCRRTPGSSAPQPSTTTPTSGCTPLWCREARFAEAIRSSSVRQCPDPLKPHFDPQRENPT